MNCRRGAAVVPRQPVRDTWVGTWNAGLPRRITCSLGSAMEDNVTVGWRRRDAAMLWQKQFCSHLGRHLANFARKESVLVDRCHEGQLYRRLSPPCRSHGWELGSLFLRSEVPSIPHFLRSRFLDFLRSGLSQIFDFLRSVFRLLKEWVSKDFRLLKESFLYFLRSGFSPIFDSLRSRFTP